MTVGHVQPLNLLHIALPPTSCRHKRAKNDPWPSGSGQALQASRLPALPELLTTASVAPSQPPLSA